MTHQELMQVLNEHDFTSTASELHGLLTGLVAGGMFRGSNDFLNHMEELFNNGLTIKGSLKSASTKLVDEIFSKLESDEFGFELLLIDEDESLSDQAQELINWVQYFLVGFGLNKRDLKMASNDVREIIEDMTSITRMEPEMEDNNENQADFYEVVEFVRVSAILCYQEFGKKTQTATESNKTLH
ncbi:UPF0149 family protein [Psychrosphaera ytuae]|uniref:UPF0149 family protein n=1 Tax=Psychrosphaera ytuae TaxID=2820710 RepID=A0A975DCX0_9GAMM|nr:UPF0149 family protein [Psychrosphaera ytuae]QTH64553.1 UPF0149 family protein [Psychrosphaera ytuae]